MPWAPPNRGPAPLMLREIPYLTFREIDGLSKSPKGREFPKGRTVYLMLHLTGYALCASHLLDTERGLC